MKAYTDLEQSKKLAQILPLESADMYYKYVLPKSERIVHTPEIGNPIDSLKWYNEGYTFRGKRESITLSEYCIPCWSLAALLNVLPYPSLHKTFSDWRCDSYDKEGKTCRLGENADNQIDACVAMIERLHEQNIL